MNNKFVLAILIFVVIGIWYKVFVRIKDTVTTDNVLQSTVLSKLENIVHVKDSTALKLNYSDPFRPKVNRQSIVLDKVDKVFQPLEYTNARPAEVWPKITYHGWVKKTDAKDALGIVEVEGTLFHLRKGDEIINGIKLAKLERDFIQLRKGSKDNYYYRD